MLEIKPLTYFIAAYEENSISAAAKRCFIAQPSISHAIKALEDKLNKTLFIRSKTGLAPTSHGTKLYEHAKHLIEHAKTIENELINTPKININLFFQGDVALAPLQPMINQLKHIPHVQLHRVSQINQSDIAFIDAEQVGKRFESFPLFREGFTLLLNEQHPLNKKSIISLDDIASDHFIERPYCSLRTEFLNLLKRKKIELNIASQAENDLQVIDLISQGFGISALPNHRANNLPKSVIAKEVDLDFSREVVMAIRASRKDLKELSYSLNLYNG